MNIDEMPAGKELDRLVAEKVMGWRFTDDFYFRDRFDWDKPRDLFGVSGCTSCTAWYPSTQMKSAWEVALKMHVALHPHGHYDVDKDENVWSGDWIAEAGEYDSANGYFEVNTRLWTRAATAPLAICRAALKAMI